MTTTAKINGRSVEFNLTKIAISELNRADLIASGFDGTMWQGVAPATARRAEKAALFYRTTAGQFVAVVIL